MKILYVFIPYFVHLGTFIAMWLGRHIHVGWGVLKREVPKLVRFFIGDVPMYIFFHTDPSLLLNN